VNKTNSKNPFENEYFSKGFLLFRHFDLLTKIHDEFILKLKFKL